MDAAPLCPEAETPASPEETGDRAPLSRDAEPGVLPEGPAPAPDEAQLLSAALTIQFAGKEHALWGREANSAPPCGQCRKCRPRLPHRSLEAACPTDKHLKRCGLDYWHYLTITYYENLNDFFERNKGGHFYFFSTKAVNRHLSY